MATTTEEFLERRPVDREEVDKIKKRMLAEVRGYRLRELREELALTQVELADRLNVSQRIASKIELGDIELIEVDKLRRYVVGLGGQLRVEVELGDERFRIA